MDARIKAWIKRDPDETTRQELLKLLDAGHESELTDRFSSRLEFGTAGLRGIIGGGPSRINRLVVRETTAGLATFLLRYDPQFAARGVVVGFDGRHMSRVFAEDVASVLAGVGIVTHLFADEVPTPLCAFAVRHLNACAGVMITASHNPKEYNGYKLYWENGAQIIPPIDAGIAKSIDEAALAEIPWLDKQRAIADGLLLPVESTVTDAYFQGLQRLSMHRPTPERAQFSIAYTPLHGVGAQLAEEALRRHGFTNVHTVQSQREPDPLFSTVQFPNPEEPGAMDAVIALAQDKQATLAVANDPDADRFAVAVRAADGSYQMLSGDEVGILLAHERILTARGTKACVGTTIVSSSLLQTIAQTEGVTYFETLTGFKWLANKAIEHEALGETFLCAYEEALGYGLGSLVRDKDGISALVGFAELAFACQAAHETVLTRLEGIYRQYGLCVTAQRSLAFTSGEAMRRILDTLRQSPPTHLAEAKVIRVDDLWLSKRTDAALNQEDLHLPKSDVLIFYLANDVRLIMRPSGTEPKFKCYYELKETCRPDESVASAKARAQSRLQNFIAKHQSEIQASAFGNDK